MSDDEAGRLQSATDEFSRAISAAFSWHLRERPAYPGFLLRRPQPCPQRRCKPRAATFELQAPFREPALERSLLDFRPDEGIHRGRSESLRSPPGATSIVLVA